MNGFWTVYKRELKGYFSTPMAYVFLVIFLFFAGYLPFEKEHFFDMRQADMRAFFYWIPSLLVFMVPCTAMRLWAEERRSGSIELLFTLPITVQQAVLGKFFAAWCFLIIALGLTLPMPITVCYLGNPDINQIVLGYLGCILVAGAYLAVGGFFSALSKNQVISFILGVVACFMLYFAGRPSTINYLDGLLPKGIVNVLANLSIENSFDILQRGILDFGGIIFFTLLIAGWVWASTIVLQERKGA